MPRSDPTPVVVLLLPERLEAFEPRTLADDLLQARGVVAVDPPRTSYGTLARIPDAFGVSIASKQARRLRRRLPGQPRAVVIFSPAQYPLARALLSQLPGCELWYGRVSRPEAALPDGGARRRLEELHLMAAERATFTFVSTDELGREEALAGRRAVVVDPGNDHGPLWDRLGRVLGVEA